VKEGLITVNFVGSNGETTKSMVIAPSNGQPREFNEIVWDRKRTLEEFRRTLEARDDRGFEAVMRALDRLDCWVEALGQLREEPVPNERLGAALLSFWISYGFHIAESLNGDLILVDVLKYLLPAYSGPGLRLYRGELAIRYQRVVYGISWTPELAVARMFADRRQHLGEGDGVVLQIDATPSMIVTGPGEHTGYLGETEYVMDPRMIGDAIRVPI